MLQAGDEFGRTQAGNNNAYCQDNAISWIDWSLAEEFAPLLVFVRRLAQLRRSMPVFRRETFLKGVRRAGHQDVRWLRFQGGSMTDEDWRQATLRCMGIKFGVSEAMGSKVLLLVNAGSSEVDFCLPQTVADGWRLVFDAALAARGESGEAGACFRSQYRIESHSTVLLEG